MIIIVFGVTGSGKSTIGKLLADKIGLPFFDGDHFHPQANVEKMRKGIPLSDEDRWPWLENLSQNIRIWHTGMGAVVACSALNEKYRMKLQSVPGIHWILLDGTKSLILHRLNARKGHFMDPGLLDSQFELLQKPEYGSRISIDGEPEDIVIEIVKELNLKK